MDFGWDVGCWRSGNETASDVWGDLSYSRLKMRGNRPAVLAEVLFSQTSFYKFRPGTLATVPSSGHNISRRHSHLRVVPVDYLSCLRHKATAVLAIGRCLHQNKLLSRSLRLARSISHAVARASSITYDVS